MTTMKTETLKNYTTSARQHVPSYSQASIVGMTCFLILILIAAFLGNCLVVCAVWSCRKLRKSTNYFIVSLAVSDILIAVTIIPFRVHHNLNQMVWNLGPTVCQLWLFMDLLCSSASTTNVALVSVDRFLALSYPFKYAQIVTRRRCIIAIGMVWCYAVFLSSLSFKNWSKDAILIHAPACAKRDKIYYLFSTILGILLPLVVLVVSYSLVFRLAFRQALMIKVHSAVPHHLDTQDNNGSEQSKSERSIKNRLLLRELKATKTLMIVVGTFLLCWFPLFVIILVQQHCPECISDGLSFTLQQIIGITFVYTLPMLNSAMNPVIYSIFNREFRSVLCLLCDKMTNAFPRENAICVITNRGISLCTSRANEESASDNFVYEQNTDYCALSSANEGNSLTPSSMFTFKNAETCYHETSV